MLVDNISEITDADIAYAEHILLKQGQTFDFERVTFIKDLTTLDLQAVPGSGKTTALLAKLLIIERYLPFKDDSGILVISHTNTAVDEIKERIGTYCPKLFAYPNFIGTIQTFINQFLLLPFYRNVFKNNVFVIDTDAYKKALIKSYNRVKWNEPAKLGPWLWRKYGKDDIKVENEVKKLYFDFKDNSIRSADTEKELIKDKNNPKYELLRYIILQTLKKGFVSYEYAYRFADYYLIEHPVIIELLQKRFAAIFVDEMQDMAQHQYEIIEKLFNTHGETIIQRIGDKNQAIYGRIVETTEIWANRENLLQISGSHRLSGLIADTVKHFGINNIDILATSDHACDVKPHLIIYNDSSIKEVIPRFATIIKAMQEADKLPRDLKHPIKAIAWRKKHERHIALANYFDFETNAVKNKEHYDNLQGYLLFFDKETTSFYYIYKNIINAILNVLRLEEVKDENDEFYSKRKLFQYLKEATNKYDEFNLNLFNWCQKILLQGGIEDVHSEIKIYMGGFLSLFGKTVSNSNSFLNETASSSGPQPITQKSNLYHTDEFDIEIETVHSVKGQTHTATLYLESYYDKKYESERLIEQFQKNSFKHTQKGHIQSTKMLYVGFSRPTHLLCFAVHEDRASELRELDHWEIVHI